MKIMPVGEFKAKCLALVDEVRDTGEPIIITKRGVPFAQLAPLENAVPRKVDVDSIFGSLRGMVTITGDIVSSEFTNKEWERMADEGWNSVEGQG
jgi:prevent-host-death family protein